MAVYPKQKTGELIGVVFLASSLLLLLALVSYSGLDSSANVSTPHAEYANYVGKIGAWVSDSFFHVLGVPALFLPVLLVVVGGRMLMGRTAEHPFVNLAGFFTAVASLSVGLSLLSPSLPRTVNFAPGGIFGIGIGNLLQIYLNDVGALVVVTTLLILSLMITTHLSVSQMLSHIGERNWNVFAPFSVRLNEWKKHRQNRKKLAELYRDKKAVVAQATPKAISRETGPEATQEASPRVNLPTVTGTSSSGSEEIVDPETVIKVRGSGLSQPYRVPSLGFLQASVADSSIDEQELIERAHVLSTKCAEFDVLGRVLQIHPGPVVTTFEFKPEAGVKYNRITNLAEDLCLALKAESIRIDRIPGKNTVGIEVPNLNRHPILLREILQSAAFQHTDSPLALGLGKLINGNTYVSDLTRMPHLLIAGATGSGKSVALNCIVCSILYKSGPDVVRFIMIDPKRLELGVYDEIPHLLTPIVTDPKQAANALHWAVAEMERRYKVLAQEGVRNIDQYNQLLQTETGREDLEEQDSLPYVVIIVDELADLMMTTGKEVEAALTRLAQMARAVGIHLVLATQRPSVDVLTGLIKANFPSRISFRVSSKIDSRTILDCNGAEQLLGHGDMLILPPGTSRLTRVHGAYINEQEIHHITEFLKRQAQPVYQEEVLAGTEGSENSLIDIEQMHDELYQEAARFVVETGKASTSLLQRRLRIGYGRAARLLDMMEHEGLVSPPEGSRARGVLVSKDYFDLAETE